MSTTTIKAALGDFSPLSRRDYEKLCRKLESPPMADKEIVALSYGITYGRFSYPMYDMSYVTKMTIAKRRLKAIRTTKKAVSLPTPVPAPWGAHGLRYDECCAYCRTQATIDNDTELCRRCAR